MKDLHEIDFFTVIAGRKFKRALLDSISQRGGRIVNILYGKGSVKANYLTDVLGLTPEENKVVITCLLNRKKSPDMFKMLNDDFNFHKPNTGIAFSIRLDKLSY